MKATEDKAARVFNVGDGTGQVGLVTVQTGGMACTCHEYLDTPLTGCQHTIFVHELLLADVHEAQRQMVAMAISVLPDFHGATA